MEVGGSARKMTLVEDWGHVQMVRCNTLELIFIQERAKQNNYC